MFKKILAITFAVILLSTVALSNITIPAEAVPQTSIMVNAISANNETLHMGVTITSGGATVQNGNTPLTFMGTKGKTYSITISNQLQTTNTNYNQTIFNHWQNDNTTLPTQTITLEQNTDLTAIYNKGETIPLVDIGILQLAAHDLYNHINPNNPPTFRGDNLEDERLNLSTLLDYGQQNIATGGEPRNTENIITFTVASQLGQEYLNYIKHGKTPQEARELTVQTFMTELKSAYSDTFHEPFPISAVDSDHGAGNNPQFPNDADGDLALRTLHSFVPGHIVVNGTIYSILDPFLYGKTTDTKSLKGISKPLDGTYDPALLNITEPISPTQSIQINLQDRDTTFGQQFQTDFTFPQLLNEIRDGSFGQYSNSWSAFRTALENSQTAMSLSTYAAPPGTPVTISGVNFDSNHDNIVIQMNDVRHAPHLDTLKTSPNVITTTMGSFGNATFTVPKVHPGVYTIYASNGNESASVPFTVLGLNSPHAPHMVGNVTDNNGPDLFVVNENTNTIYDVGSVFNSDFTSENSTISIIDGNTDKITSVIPIDYSQIQGLAIDEKTNKFYIANVTNFQYSSFMVMDGKTHKITNVIPIGDGSNGFAVNLAFDPNTNKVFVPMWDGPVLVINPSTLKVIDTIHTLPGDNSSYNIAINEKTDRVYVGNIFDGSVSVIDAKTDKVIGVIQEGTPDSPNQCWLNDTCDTNGSHVHGVTVNEATNTIYAANELDGTFVTIDGKTDKVTKILKVVDNELYGSAVDEKRNTIFQTVPYDGLVDVIDGKTNKVVDRIPMGTLPAPTGCSDFNSQVACTDYGASPQAIAINEKTGKVYVAVYPDLFNLFSGDGSIVVLDANTHHVISKTQIDFGHHHK
ncbi:MAG TPA: IPT/TIG domain-containing protein [Candidatus Bathyarchaeia archaeon]|nr:IPT/TIG domain-containing protein [Candidatus Bathyarchaeia archaeon]